MRIDRPSAAEFLKEHGRLPRLDKEGDPWAYRGYLLYHALDGDGIISDRWNWWATEYATDFSKVKAGELPPKLGAHGTIGALGRGENQKHVETLSKFCDAVERTGVANGYEYTVRYMLHAFGDTSVDLQYMKNEEANELLYRNVNLAFFADKVDIFGTLKAERTGKWNPTAFFPTPMELCLLMSEMTLAGDPQPLWTRTMNDPCVGTGRMALAASNYVVRIYVQDIDRGVLDVCRLNGWIHVPWMVRPPPPLEREHSASAATAEVYEAPAPPVQAEPEVPAVKFNKKGQGLLF